jgi:hypothetical protein
MTPTKNEVRRARELLVRFGNRADWLKRFPRDKENLKELKIYHRRLLALPSGVLERASDELNAREAVYSRARLSHLQSRPGSA